MRSEEMVFFSLVLLLFAAVRVTELSSTFLSSFEYHLGLCCTTIFVAYVGGPCLGPVLGACAVLC